MAPQGHLNGKKNSYDKKIIKTFYFESKFLKCFQEFVISYFCVKNRRFGHPYKTFFLRHIKLKTVKIEYICKKRVAVQRPVL